MGPTPQTLVQISHPSFGKGYQEWREDYFRVPYPWIDMDLVGCLEAIFKERPHESEEEREARLYKQVGLFVGRTSGRVLARQPYEDGTPERHQQQEGPFTPQVPVEIFHPMFRRGYQEGRERYFQERYILPDDVLLNCLETAFEPREYPFERAEEREHRLHDEIGQLVGEICGWVQGTHTSLFFLSRSVIENYIRSITYFPLYYKQLFLRLLFADMMPRQGDRVRTEKVAE